MNVQVKQPIDTDTNRPALVTADQLQVDFAYLIAEVVKLETQASQAPAVIEDDDDLGVINGLVVDLRGKQKSVKDKKDYEKRPHLDANSVLEGFFTGLVTRLASAQTKLESAGKRYLDNKRAAEQARLAEIARQERAAADRRAAEAATAAAAQKPVEAAVATQQAAAAEERAVEADKRAESKPAELARTRTEAGTATLQEIWKFRIDAFAMIDLEALRPYLAPADVEKAIGKFVAINKDKRPLAGVTIYSDTKPNFR